MRYHSSSGSLLSSSSFYVKKTVSVILVISIVLLIATNTNTMTMSKQQNSLKSFFFVHKIIISSQPSSTSQNSFRVSATKYKDKYNHHHHFHHAAFIPSIHLLPPFNKNKESSSVSHSLLTLHHHRKACLNKSLFYNNSKKLLSSSLSSYSSSSSISDNNNDNTIIIPKQDNNNIDNDDNQKQKQKQESIFQELKSLISQIQYHDYLYYTPGQTPILSDDEYDALTRREEEIFTLYPNIIQDRIRHDHDDVVLLQQLLERSRFKSGRVGLDIDTTIHDMTAAAVENRKFNVDASMDSTTNINTTTANTSSTPLVSTNKLYHLSNDPMKSLDNAMNNQHVIAWLNRIRKELFKHPLQHLPQLQLQSQPQLHNDNDNGSNKQLDIQIIAEPKLDGLSLSLRYCRVVDPTSHDDQHQQHDHTTATTSTNTSSCYHPDSFTYVLKWGATRGDGTRGEDVTEAVMDVVQQQQQQGFIPYSFTIPSSSTLLTSAMTTSDDSISSSLNNIDNNTIYSNSQSSETRTFQQNHLLIPPSILEIRGEIILPKSTFQKWKNKHNTTTVDHSNDNQQKDTSSSSSSIDDNNDKSDAKISTHGFSNARNAASGILLRRKGKKDLSIQEVEDTRLLRSELQFYAYSIASSHYNEHDDTTTNTISDDDEFRIGSGDAQQHTQLEQQSTTMERLLYDGLMVRTFLESIGFSTPNPIQIATISLYENQLVTEMDCQLLLKYHDKLSSNRPQQQHQQSLLNNDTITISISDKNSSPSNILLDYDVDGAVYKLSSLHQRKIMGSSSRAPRWAIAHKFPSLCALTKLRAIDVQIGRTGRLTPVAILDPVDIGGVTVSRATLHNFQYAQNVLRGVKICNHEIIDNNVDDDDDDDDGVIGVRSGASVLISRAGDVIPQVLRRIDDDTEPINWNRSQNYISLNVPKTCPACGSRTFFDSVKRGSGTKSRKETALPNSDNSSEVTYMNSQSYSGQELRCGGPQLLCPPRAVSALSHAFSREGLDVSGFSEARIQQLLDEKLISVPVDIFELIDESGSFAEKLSSLPGWGEKSVHNLQSELRKVVRNGVTLAKFINSLGLRHVGSNNSKLLATAYVSVSSFMEDVEAATDYNPNEGDEAIQSRDRHQYFRRLSGDASGNDTSMKNVKGIGPSVIESLLSFAQNAELIKAAKDLMNAVPVLDDSGSLLNSSSSSNYGNDEGKSEERPMEGKTVVFTGTLPNNMNRSTAQDLAMKLLGAKSTPNSLSKKTDILVAGEKGGTKLEKARELGIEIMDVADFIDLIEKYK